jgi:hypothetical protein
VILLRQHFGESCLLCVFVELPLPPGRHYATIALRTVQDGQLFVAGEGNAY